jgi:hypothetical protein
MAEPPKGAADHCFVLTVALFLSRMVAAKNSRKRRTAVPLAPTIAAGTTGPRRPLQQ